MEIQPAELTQQGFDQEARDAFSKLSEQLGRHGLNVKPWTDSRLPYFQLLPVEAQIKVLSDIRDLTAEMEIHRERDLWTIQNQILWRLLHQFKFKFPTDLFEELPKDAVVELYTKDNIQIFRSLQFFKICSYTLEDVYSRPWYELYDKDEDVMRQSLAMLEKVISGEVRGVHRKPFPIHNVREKGAGSRFLNRIEPIMLCFFEDEMGNLTGFLNAFRSVECRTIQN